MKEVVIVSAVRTAMGSFGGVSWELIFPAIIIIFITIIAIIRSSRKLDILQLGEPEAYRLGIDIKRLRFNIIIKNYNL